MILQLIFLLALSLSLSLSLSLPTYHAIAQNHNRMQHTILRWLSGYSCWSYWCKPALIDCLPFSLSLSLSLTHTHTHSRSLFICFSKCSIQFNELTQNEFNWDKISFDLVWLLTLLSLLVILVVSGQWGELLSKVDVTLVNWFHFMNRLINTVTFGRLEENRKLTDHLTLKITFK